MKRKSVELVHIVGERVTKSQEWEILSGKQKKSDEEETTSGDSMGGSGLVVGRPLLRFADAYIGRNC